MSFTNLTAGSAFHAWDTDTRDDWANATSDDVFEVTLRNGQQFKIIAYNDNDGTFKDFTVGRPAGATDYVNLFADDMEAGGTFTIAAMDGTPVYTFSTGTTLYGCFRVSFDGTTYLVEQDSGDNSGFPNAAGDYPGGFDQITTLYNGPVCFLPGTRITTPGGECDVESLRIGDLVTTVSGAQKPVKWIGRMQLPLNRFTRATATPVCIRAGALGENLPQRDLYVSADHAIAIAGVLVNAGALVNGRRIVRCEDFAGDSVDYFQIELDDHDLILAEGLAVETFLEDGDNRAKFDNAADFHTRYPEHVPGLPMALGRVMNARMMPAALRRQLAGRHIA